MNNQNQINCCPDNCPREKLPPWMIAPGILSLMKVVPQKIAPWMIARIIARIIALRTFAPQKIVLKILAPGQLPPRIIAFQIISSQCNFPSGNWHRE